MQAVAEATRAAIQATTVAGTERRQNGQNVGPRQSRPIKKQPTFNWEVEDKNNELKNLRLEINNIFKSYGTPQAEQIAFIKNG